MSLKESARVEETYLMYPNPASDRLQIRISLEEKKTVTIQAKSFLDGKTHWLFKGRLATGIQDVSLNVSSLNQGIYQLSVNSGDTKLSAQRLLIKR